MTFTSCKSQSTQNDIPIDDDGVVVLPSNLFVGTYTRDEGWVNGQADGIYRVSIEENAGLSLDETAAELINPSFVSISPDQKNLYAVSELGRGNEPTGYVHAYTIEDDLSLTFIAKYPTNAKSPAHVSVDATGTFVFAANYQGGVAMVFERLSDGSLELLQQLDHPGSNSHTHMAKVSPDNNFLFIPDLGNDQIWSYRINHSTKSLSKTMQESSAVASGAGPRHMSFHPTLNIAYVINELNSTVSVFDYDPSTGELTEKQVITTLPAAYNGSNSTADIHVHPNGNFLYSSNRGHNSLSSFSIDETTGELVALTHTSVEGEFPRNFAIHPSGETIYVANQNSNNITVFDLDVNSGSITFTGEKLNVGTPVCLAFFTN